MNNVQDLKNQISLIKSVINKLVYGSAEIRSNNEKRTAIIFGNHYLISHGVGLMVIPVEKIEKYKTLLLQYYEDKSDELINFLIKECFIPLK